MTKIQCIALIVLVAQLDCAIEAKAKPTTGLSYIDFITLGHTDGIWHCDTLICPSETFGCRILRKIDANKDQLHCNNICYDKTNASIFTSTWTVQWTEGQTIDIDINSFDDAVTLGWTGYSSSMQSVKATIATADWKHFQEMARENMQKVVESMSQLDDL